VQVSLEIMLKIAFKMTNKRRSKVNNMSKLLLKRYLDLLK